MRTIIDLPASQLEALDRWRQREGLSRAEAVRRAISAHVAVLEAAATVDAFGLWRRRPIDGLKHQRKLRSEWVTRRPHPRGRG